MQQSHDDDKAERFYFFMPWLVKCICRVVKGYLSISTFIESVSSQSGRCYYYRSQHYIYSINGRRRCWLRSLHIDWLVCRWRPPPTKLFCALEVESSLSLSLFSPSLHPRALPLSVDRPGSTQKERESILFPSVRKKERPNQPTTHS